MKHMLLAAVAALCLASFGHPGPSPHHSLHRGPTPRPMPMVHRGPAPRQAPMPHHRHHHYSSWGRGGSHFWPGFVGGVVGSSFVRPPIPALPPPPPRPHVFAVWVEPVIELRPIYDSYGRIIGYNQFVIQAGYWR